MTEHEAKNKQKQGSDGLSVSLFSLIPIEVFQDKRLTLEHVRVLGTLLSFRAKNTDVVWPSRALIAQRCGMHISNISAATSDLVMLGWLEKEGKGGFSKASRYRITVPDLDAVNPKERASKLKAVVESATVAQQATVVDSTTVADQAIDTVVESATRGVAQSTTGKEQTTEQTSEQTTGAAGEKSPAAPRSKSKLSPEMQEACRKTWEAYCIGYAERYSVEPVKNAKVAGQIVDFVKRVGMEDAPGIAGWFPSHKSSFYNGRGHTVDCLLKDSEKLRTEWVTGTQMTSTKARQQDRAGATMSAVESILAKRGGA